MTDRELKDFLDLIYEAELEDHPQITPYREYGLNTGDYRPLVEHVMNKPQIRAMIKHNVYLRRDQQRQSPFPIPTRKQAEEHLSGPIEFGTVNAQGSMFGVNPIVVLALITMILGRPKSGKSVLLFWLISQLLDWLKTSSHKFNILILESAKAEFRSLASVCDNIKVITPEVLKINPWEVPSWADPREWLYAVVRIFTRENWLLETTQNILTKLLDKRYKLHGIYDGSRNYPTMADLKEDVDREIAQNRAPYYGDMLKRLSGRLNDYCENPVFQTQFGLPFEVLLNENIVFEMDRGLPESGVNFLAAFFSSGLIKHCQKERLVGSKLRHLLVIDEASHILQPNRDVRDFGVSTIQRDLTIGREYGVSYAIASQFPDSLPEVVSAVSFLKVCFPMTTNSKSIRDDFGLTEEQADFIFKLDKYGQAIVRYADYKDPFTIKVPPPIYAGLPNDQEIEEKNHEFWSELRAAYSNREEPRPVEVIGQVPADSAALLFYLSKNPFSRITVLSQAPGFNSPSESRAALAWLETNAFVKIEKYPTSGTKPAQYPILTEKALQYLKLDRFPGQGQGTFEHRLYCHHIGQRLTEAGWTKVAIEGRMQGSSKAIDVLAFHDELGWFAHEVELTTAGTRLVVSNIVQDLNAGVDEVVIITRDKDDRQSCMERVADVDSLVPYLDQLSFRTIGKFRPRTAQ